MNIPKKNIICYSNDQTHPTMTKNNTVKSIDSSEFSVESVKFGTVEIRRHPIVLGDNPSTKKGPSFEIGWDFQEESVLNIEEYERNRPARRSVYQLRMPGVFREQLLIRSGSNRSEIRDQVAKREAILARENSILKRTKKFISKALSDGH